MNVDTSRHGVEQDWVDEALCADSAIPQDAWLNVPFGAGKITDGNVAAFRTCHVCPFKAECLARWPGADGAGDGFQMIWGGRVFARGQRKVLTCAECGGQVQATTEGRVCLWCAAGVTR